jgi:hypothetical protein
MNKHMTEPTEENKTKWFVELYITALRKACNNIYLKPPKEKSKDWEILEGIRKEIDKIGGDYMDFINLQFSIFKRLGFPPKPKHLISQNAINRYKIHQKLKNRYHYKEYSVDGDYLLVHQTNKRYPISQVNLPSYSDPDANFAFALADEGIHGMSKEDKEKVREVVIYTIIKLQYKGHRPTEKLLKLYKEVQNGIN